MSLETDFMIKFNEKFFILILVVICSINGIFWCSKSFGMPPAGDGVYYNEIAENLLGGRGLTYQGDKLYEPPGYSLFIAGTYGIFGKNYDAVRMIQILLIIISMVIICKLSSKLFGKKVGVLTGLLMALFYGFPLSAAKFNKEILQMFLLALLVYTLYRGYFVKKVKWFFVSGIILGLAVLTNGIMQVLFVPIIVLFYFIYKNEISLRKLFLMSLIFILPFGFIVGGWSIINKFKSNTFSVASIDGELLSMRADIMENVSKNYLGHFVGHAFGYYFAEQLYPNIDPRAFRDFSYTIARREDLARQGYNKSEENKTLRKEGIARIISQPHKYFFVSFLDFLSLNSPLIPYGSPPDNSWVILTFAEGRHVDYPATLKTLYLMGLRLIWYIFFIFVIYGIVSSMKNNWKKASWFLLIIIYFNILYSFLHAIPRYALQIYPFYMMFFSIGIFVLFNKLNFQKFINKTLCLK